MIARLRAELKRAAEEVAQQANTELEQHAAERRRALHDVADRLRKRERDLQELVEREGNEAAQRIQLALGDIERRQVEQLQRTVSRETTRYSEAASLSFDSSIKAAREEAARRLSRELDLSVERFAREAEGVLTERLNASDGGGGRSASRSGCHVCAPRWSASATKRSSRSRIARTRWRPSLRERLREIAADAESERAVLDGRLHELGRASTSSRRERKDSVSCSNFPREGSSRSERITLHHAPDDRTTPVGAREGRVVAPPRADRGGLPAAARRAARALGG